MGTISEIIESAMNVSFVDSYKKKDTNGKNGQFDPKKVLTYTPWARAVEEALRIDPNFTWGVNKPHAKIYGDLNNPTHITQVIEADRNYFDDGNTCWVETWTLLGGKHVTMTLPVMDGRNQPIRVRNWEEKTAQGGIITHQGVTSNDVNKAIMRCLVKTLAVGYGLGLSIYYGEEMNDEQIDSAIDGYIEKLNACNTREELGKVYNDPANAIFVAKPKAMEALKRRTEIVDKQNQKKDDTVKK